MVGPSFAKNAKDRPPKILLASKGAPPAYTYNAENEITSANGVTYVYDGNRMRTKKSGGTLYWRGTTGTTIAETTLGGADVNEYIFFAGRRVARIGSAGGVYYYQADQIGSTRAIANVNGVNCYDADFTPFGTEMSHISTCAGNYKFAGYERDSETGLDYAMNRYYNPRMGRFMTPDPAGIASASAANPQSLHRYAYVLNNPLSGIDPLGLSCVYISDNGSSIEAVDPTSTDYDSAQCLDDGGVYFLGNDYSNVDDYIVSAESGWVGQSDSMGNLLQAACSTGTNCTDQEFRNFAGPGYSMTDTYIIGQDRCGDACDREHHMQKMGSVWDATRLPPPCPGGYNVMGDCWPRGDAGPGLEGNCEAWNATLDTMEDVGWLWTPFTLGASEGLAKVVTKLNKASGLCK